MRKATRATWQRGWPWGRLALALALAGALALVAATLGGRPPPWWALALDGAALLAVVGLGVWIQGAGLFARPLLGVRPDAAEGRVALTFDDGPHPEATRAVLALLAARGHKATFFPIGHRAAAAPELLSEIARAGHALGNHSYTHAPHWPFWRVPSLLADLARADALLAPAAGARTRWFRAPVGIVSPPVAEAARRAGLELVGWSTTARDGVASTTVEAAARRLVAGLRPGAVLVLHDGGTRPIAPAVLVRVLDALEARGLKSVTLDELFGGDA